MTVYLVKIKVRYEDGWGRSAPAQAEIVGAYTTLIKAEENRITRREKPQPHDIGYPWVEPLKVEE